MTHELPQLKSDSQASNEISRVAPASIDRIDRLHMLSERNIVAANDIRDKKLDTLPNLTLDGTESPSHYHIISSVTRNVDRPTVAVLDFFSNQRPVLNLNGRGIVHGELSARLAEENGFNVIRLDMNPVKPEHDLRDFSRVLNQVAADIESGKLRLGKGDVLNLSFGQRYDLNFETASKILGMQINGSNLAQQREHILQRMKELASDPSADADLRRRMQTMLATNEAISRIQKSGVEVVHAAGNNGSNCFSLDFMNAKHQLQAARQDGSIDTTLSATHSLSTRSPGEVLLSYQPFNSLEPTPTALQTGRYHVLGSNVSFDAREFGGLNLTGSTARESPQDSGLTIHERTNPTLSPLFTSSSQNSTGEFDRHTGPTDPELRPVRLPQALRVENTVRSNAPIHDPSWVVDRQMGTSFSNVFFLPTQMERLRRVKSSSQ